MNSMLVGGHLTHTHCIPCVMNSMYAGFSCVEFHVRRAPCLPGSTLARFHAYRVPVTLGSTHTGLHLLPVLVHRSLVCRVPSMPGSICSQLLCDELQPRRVPCMPGSMCYEFLCVLFLCLVNYCVPDSMHAGFYVL